MDPVDPGGVAMLLRPVERRQRAVLLELRREPVSVAEDFLAPLEALGAARPKGMAVAAWKAGLARLVDDLRYLEPDELALLRRDVEVGLRQTRVWLPPVAILSMAALIRPDPRAQAERAASIARFMRSSPGQAALAGGYAVEMLASAEACGHGFRVTDFQIGRWQAAAAERDRHLELDRARAAAGDLPAAARVAAVEARQRRAMELCRSGEE